MIAALKDLGLTFLIGAFTLLGFEAICWYLFGVRVTGFFRGRLGLYSTKPPVDEATDLAIWLFVVSSFAVGLIAEDISYGWQDPGALPKAILNIAAHPDTLRREALVAAHADKNSACGTQLGGELAERGAVSKVVKDTSASRLENWLSQPKCSTTLSMTDAERAALLRRVYYHAKNWSYSQQNYFQELDRLQSRIDLTRSLLIVSCCLVLLTTCISGVAAIVAFLLPCYRSSGPAWSSSDSPKFPDSLLFRVSTILQYGVEPQLAWAWANRAFCIVCVFAMIGGSSALAFRFETTEFYKHAFGYYSTSLVPKPIDGGK
jgi:hypothetical protein